ncbi:hypothetical protein CIY_27230 [Butyrivibrio fibrisolvens 16/4]|nr:hypothetical protein CIY_27230 [Butyrivibrio fibrisolvens 16/4]
MATKRQHYIWRGYLKRWTGDGTVTGRIWVRRLKTYGNQGIEAYTSIMKIGYENYFYDMSGFGERDVEIV